MLLYHKIPLCRLIYIHIIYIWLCSLEISLIENARIYAKRSPTKSTTQIQQFWPLIICVEFLASLLSWLSQFNQSLILSFERNYVSNNLKVRKKILHILIYVYLLCMALHISLFSHQNFGRIFVHHPTYTAIFEKFDTNLIPNFLFFFFSGSILNHLLSSWVQKFHNGSVWPDLFFFLMLLCAL